MRNVLPAALRRRNTAIANRTELHQFLESRASFVAQTALYGYLRTRAGMRYPVLFDDDGFSRSVNIAKWHVWLGCLSDLCIFAGGLLIKRTSARPDAVGTFMLATLDAILEATGIPADAGGEFAAHAQRVRARITLCDWAAVPDDATPFSESTEALVYWAPIADELKQHDVQIVRNSIRFLWQDVRRALRRDLDAAGVMAPAA
ncbi:MAG: esterase [Betaproteobacteria bacterium]|nr:esterase [Betaproteobacteria bacterium]